MNGALGAVALAGAALVSGAAAAPGIFDREGERVQRVVVTIGPASGRPSTPSPAPGEADSPMLARLRGELWTFTGPALAELRALPVARGGTTWVVRGGEVLGVAHPEGASAKAGEGSKRVEIARSAGADAWWGYTAVELDGQGRAIEATRTELKREAFTAAIRTWPLYRGRFDGPVAGGDGAGAPSPAPGLPVGVVSEMPRPLFPSSWVFDRRTLAERINGGRGVTIPGVTRVSAEERVFARPPRGYDPGSPAGLLIWIDASPDGRPPGVVGGVCDELNLVCVGPANAGNARPIADRHQLVFDALAGVSALYHIDPRRVYLTGVSGGGKVASILAACFPDVFAGAVPIVGLSTSRGVPLGGGRAIPAAYGRPVPRLAAMWRSRRFAPMTGGRDFNHAEILAAAQLLEGDGMAVRVFDEPEMGHELPSVERFAEALRWVDEPYRTARLAEIETARAALAAYSGPRDRGAALSREERKALVAVTAAGPWTGAAWEAAKILGAGP